MVVHRDPQVYRPPMPLLRTILRRTFYTAAALSTLLLLATLIVWPVSHYRSVYVGYVAYTGDACFVGGADYSRAWAFLGSGYSPPPRMGACEFVPRMDPLVLHNMEQARS